MTFAGVVVGYDGSPASRVALDWAADTAAAYGRPLTILTARPDAEAELLDLSEAIDEGLLRQATVDMLADAAAVIGEQHPDVDVQVLVSPDSPVVSLLAAAQEADIVVLGSRGLGGFQGLVLGSTALNVTPYATCPVVVQYEPDEATAEARAFARHPDQVVVGFDGSRSARHALGFALRHARATGLGVAVVIVTKGRPERAPTPVHLDTPDLPAAVRDVMAAAAEQIGDQPDVAVLHGVGPPARILVAEAAGAPLAVVGSRGRGGFRQLMLGSVGLQMLLYAECPVAIVHDKPDPSAT